MNSLNVFKEKAIKLRKEHKSLDEITTLLQLPRTTIYYWIKDIESVIKRKPGPTKSGEKTRMVAAQKRQDAYDFGIKQYEELSKNNKFKTFLILYLCEGYKKDRNAVNITNSDPDIIKLSYDVMKVLTHKTPRFGVQVHLDNDIDLVRTHWANLLSIKKDSINVYIRKTSMTNRNGRLPYGIFQIGYSDTYFRSRIQSWLDLMKQEWSVCPDLNRESSVPKTDGITKLSYTPMN